MKRYTHSAAAAGNTVFTVAEERDSHSILRKVGPFVRADLKFSHITLISVIAVARDVTELCFALVGRRKERSVKFSAKEGMLIAKYKSVFKFHCRRVISELDIRLKHGIIGYGVSHSHNEQVFTQGYYLSSEETNGLFFHIIICVNVPVVVDIRNVLIALNDIEAVTAKLPALVDKRADATVTKRSDKERSCYLISLYLEGNLCSL